MAMDEGVSGGHDAVQSAFGDSSSGRGRRRLREEQQDDHPPRNQRPRVGEHRMEISDTAASSDAEAVFSFTKEEIQQVRHQLERTHNMMSTTIDFDELMKEYARFLRIKIAGLPVVTSFLPPFLIDLCWQAHIVCTRAYEAYCQRCNHGKILHYVPPPNDTASVPQRYRLTLEGYANLFGRRPTNKEIWPDDPLFSKQHDQQVTGKTPPPPALRSNPIKQEPQEDPSTTTQNNTFDLPTINPIPNVVTSDSSMPNQEANHKEASPALAILDDPDDEAQICFTFQRKDDSKHPSRNAKEGIGQKLVESLHPPRSHQESSRYSSKQPQESSRHSATRNRQPRRWSASEAPSTMQEYHDRHHSKRFRDPSPLSKPRNARDPKSKIANETSDKTNERVHVRKRIMQPLATARNIHPRRKSSLPNSDSDEEEDRYDDDKDDDPAMKPLATGRNSHPRRASLDSAASHLEYKQRTIDRSNHSQTASSSAGIKFGSEITDDYIRAHFPASRHLRTPDFVGVKHFLIKFGNPRGTTPPRLKNWHKQMAVNPKRSTPRNFYCRQGHEWASGEFEVTCRSCRDGSRKLQA